MENYDEVTQSAIREVLRLKLTGSDIDELPERIEQVKSEIMEDLKQSISRFKHLSMREEVNRINVIYQMRTRTRTHMKSITLHERISIETLMNGETAFSLTDENVGQAGVLAGVIIEQSTLSFLRKNIHSVPALYGKALEADARNEAMDLNYVHAIPPKQRGAIPYISDYLMECIGTETFERLKCQMLRRREQLTRKT